MRVFGDANTAVATDLSVARGRSGRSHGLLLHKASLDHPPRGRDEALAPRGEPECALCAADRDCILHSPLNHEGW